MLQPPTKRVGTHISPSPLFRIRLRDTLISKAAMRKSFQTAGRSPLGYLFGIAVPHWFASVRLLSPANRRIGLWPQCPLWVKSGHRNGSAECPLYPQKRTSGSRNKGLVLTLSRSPYGEGTGTPGGSAISAARLISSCRLAWRELIAVSLPPPRSLMNSRRLIAPPKPRRRIVPARTAVGQKRTFC